MPNAAWYPGDDVLEASSSIGPRGEGAPAHHHAHARGDAQANRESENNLLREDAADRGCAVSTALQTDVAPNRSVRSLDAPPRAHIVPCEHGLPPAVAAAPEPPPPPTDRPASPRTALCPHCGRDTKPDSPFCTHCRRQLMDRVPRCRRCGADVHPADRLCAYCGQPLDSTHSPVTLPPGHELV
ncbi:MAG: zinc ribbon domain-containing protein [Tepidisphaerales bacterium]